MEVHVKPVIMLNKKQVHTDRSKQFSNQFGLNINKNLHKLLNKNLMNYWRVQRMMQQSLLKTHKNKLFRIVEGHGNDSLNKKYCHFLSKLLNLILQYSRRMDYQKMLNYSNHLKMDMAKHQRHCCLNLVIKEHQFRLQSHSTRSRVEPFLKSLTKRIKHVLQQTTKMKMSQTLSGQMKKKPKRNLMMTFSLTELYLKNKRSEHA